MNKTICLTVVAAFHIIGSLQAMESKKFERTSYYGNQPINKDLVLSKVGPQAKESVHQKASEIIKNNPDIEKALKLSSKLTKQELISQRDLRGKITGTDFTFDQKKYGIWLADSVNKAFALWHGDEATKGINIWDPNNRTDENFGKIKVGDSYQTISARACMLAVLDAKNRIPVEQQKLVKIFPVYLHRILQEKDEDQNTDESYVVIRKYPQQAIKLAENPHIVPSIPADGIKAIYTIIMDNSSGASGALWDNSNIAVELDEQKNFKRWAIDLREKPNNQAPQTFFNGDINFHENCQYEGLKTLANVLNKSENKQALRTLQTLVEQDESISKDNGRINLLKKELNQLLETKKS